MRLVDADAVIDAIEKSKTAKAEDGEVFVAKINVLMKIDALPTIQPQTGKWNSLGGIMDVGDGEEIQCNKCKATYMIVYRDNDYNFCPNCGARMVTE